MQDQLNFVEGLIIAFLKDNKEGKKRLVEWFLNTVMDKEVQEQIRAERAKKPDERWQTDIMYIKIMERFFYLIIFIDEYSRYIVHHALLTSMDADSVSLEAQSAIN